MRDDSAPDSQTRMEKQLKEAHHALHLTQTRFHDYQVKTNLLVTSLKSRLYKKDDALRWQQQQQEQQTKRIVSHLLFLEGQLRREQRQILRLLEEKELLIRQQRLEIDQLATDKMKLLTALKQFHIPVGSNGVHGNRLVVVAGEKEEEEELPPSKPLKPVSDVDRNRAHKKRFTEMRERLRRHRSSFELHSPEPLETLEEGALRYGSQDNLTSSGCRGDALRERRLSAPCRNERPRSLTELPSRITEYPLLELHKEDDLKIEDLEIEEEGEVEGGDSRDDDIFQNGDGSPTRLTKSSTVPEEMSQITAVNGQNGKNSKNKPRPLSEPNLGPVPVEKSGKSPVKTAPPVHSSGETNPFKSIKTMLRRKGSKSKNKKRSSSLPQGTNQEYYEALKKHFDKYDLS